MVTFFQKLKEQQRAAGRGSRSEFLGFAPGPGQSCPRCSRNLVAVPDQEISAGGQPRISGREGCTFYDRAGEGRTLQSVGAASGPTTSACEGTLGRPQAIRARCVSRFVPGELGNCWRSTFLDDHVAERRGRPRDRRLRDNRQRLHTPGGGAKGLGEATRQLITSIRDTNPGLRQTGNPKDLPCSAGQPRV